MPKKGKHISASDWGSTDVQIVDSLPKGIDGKRVFKLPPSSIFSRGRFCNVIPCDGRKWRKAQTANVKGMKKGSRKIQICAGSHLCDNQECVFFETFSTNNNQYFTTSRREGFVKCKFCEEIATYIPCKARKFTEFCDEHTLVKHIGVHTCPIRTGCSLPKDCLLYTSPSPRDGLLSRMPSSA